MQEAKKKTITKPTKAILKSRITSEMLGRPATNDTVSVPSSMLPPGADIADVYGLELTGDCLEPKAHDGDIAICCSTVEIKVGGFVALFMADGSIPQIKRIVMLPFLPVGTPLSPHSNAIPAIIVESLNPRRMIGYQIDKLKAAHAVLGFTKKPEPSEREVIPTMVQRKCLQCREPSVMEKQYFLCAKCRRKATMAAGGQH